jgi:hypothetical protein
MTSLSEVGNITVIQANDCKHYRTTWEMLMTHLKVGTRIHAQRYCDNYKIIEGST